MTSAPVAATKPWDAGGGNRGFIIALACAAVLEAGLVGGLLVGASRHKSVDDGPKAPLRIAIQVPPAPPPPVPPPPTPPPPTPPPPTPPPPAPPPPTPAPPTPAPVAPAPPPLLPMPPVPAPPPVPVAHPHRIRHHEPPPRPVEKPAAAPVPQEAAPPPPQPVAASAPSANDTATFEAALRRAVQASLIFPAGAQAAHEQGVAHVRFVYRDGVVSDATLIASTGFPVLDTAALQTVRRAHYPSPPADFAGRTLSVDVAVVFRAAETSMESD